MRFQPNLLQDEPTGDRFLTADGQHGFAIHPYVWHVFPALSSSPDASKGTGLQGIHFAGLLAIETVSDGPDE